MRARLITDPPKDAEDRIICVGDTIAVAFNDGSCPIIRKGKVISFSPFIGDKDWLGLDMEWLAGYDLPKRNTQIQSENTRILIMEEVCNLGKNWKTGY